MTIDINDPVTIAAKADIFAVLDTSTNEVPALLAALKEGRVDGWFYKGKCCCLVGTLAQAAGLDPYSVPIRENDGAIHGKLARASFSPAEMWFKGILQGDDPETSKVSALTVAWVEEWMAKHTEVTK